MTEPTFLRDAGNDKKPRNTPTLAKPVVRKTGLDLEFASAEPRIYLPRTTGESSYGFWMGLFLGIMIGATTMLLVIPRN